MSNADIFTMSVRNLLKRKLRTFLTVLGVVIGTASIVVMISLGLAMNATFDREMEKMGDITTITVYNPSGGNMGYMASDGSQSQQQSVPTLDDNAITQFRQIPGVLAATAITQSNMYFKSGKYIMYWCNMYGIDPVSMEALGYKASEGRLLEADDVYEVVFGAYTEMFFALKNDRYGGNRYYDYMTSQVKPDPLVNVMEDKMQMSMDYTLIYPEYADQNDTESEDAPRAAPMKPINVKCVGVLEEKSYNTDTAVFMSIATLQKLKANQEKYEKSRNESYGYFTSNNNRQNTGYDTAFVKCKDLDTVKKINEQIKEMGYYSEIPTQSLDSMQQMASSLQALLGAIGAVSLFVAAIGIANTMIMAIYERTREIGVMKVIGAAISDIQKLFLLEAALIGFFGGLFGLLLSLGISYILNTAQISFLGTISMYLQDDQSSVSLITPWLCGLALVFATCVGLVSGYFPARRAMKLSALSAIRTE